MIVSDRTYTPEDLLNLPDGKHFELVNGRLVESDMSLLACLVVARLVAAMTPFVDQRRLGVVATEVAYRCFDDDQSRIRRPDVSFIRLERLSPEMASGLVTVAPDLVVEVVSEKDPYYEVEQKISEYMQAKVPLVWIVNPLKKSVKVYHGDSYEEVTENGELSGADVVPGLQISLKSLFDFPSLPAPR